MPYQVEHKFVQIPFIPEALLWGESLVHFYADGGYLKYIYLMCELQFLQEIVFASFPNETAFH